MFIKIVFRLFNEMLVHYPVLYFFQTSLDTRVFLYYWTAQHTKPERFLPLKQHQDHKSEVLWPGSGSVTEPYGKDSNGKSFMKSFPRGNEHQLSDLSCEI